VLFQFRAGHRKSEQMAPFAAGLTDEISAICCLLQRAETGAA
jgi:hypothetical protein